MTGGFASLIQASAQAAKSSGGSLGVAVGLPAGQNVVEGTETNLMVGAAAANSNWRKAAVAAGAALVTLVPLLGGIWFMYKAGGAFADYAVGAIVVGIGVHEVMEGLKDRPRDGGPRPFALDGPLGIDPADADQIKRFQAEHGLEQDGDLGPRTRGAILAELSRRGEQPQPNRLGVDVTEESSVRGFQQRVGLRPDGVIGPRTQGALAAESARHVPDPADADSIREFQRRIRLPATGIIDARTQEVLRSRDGHGSGFAPPSADGKAREAGETVSFVDTIDLTISEDISRFQRDRGLSESGDVDRRTQGALRAETVWHARQARLDAADPDAVKGFQSSRGLEPTGIVDEPTRESLRAAVATMHAPASARWAALGIDPTDPESIERFQALHALERTGEIDAPTRTALRRTEEWTAGVDPADPSSMRRFQAEHGLEPTGVVDAETQGAMRAYRAELQQRRSATTPEQAPGDYPVEPTDPHSVKKFQHQHGLPESGTVGAPTQTRLHKVVADRRRRAVERADQAQQSSGLIAKYRDAWPGYFGFLLEGSEAGLFTIGIAQGTHQYAAAAIAGGASFAAPWVGLIWLRGWLESRPKWVFELTIGGVLVTAGTIFGLLRATGGFG